MQSNKYDATWFIPCSIIQASSALYALSMIKHVAYSSHYLTEVAKRKESLAGSLFSKIMLSNGKFSEYRDQDIRRYALGFNFFGRYTCDLRGEGLQLSFYTPNIDKSIYSFSPLNAAVFTQAILDVFDINNEIEIVYSYIDKESGSKSGCFSINKEYLDHFTIDNLMPAHDESAGKSYYAYYLDQKNNELPQSFVLSCSSGQVNADFNSLNDKVRLALIDNPSLYSKKKISYFDFKLLSSHLSANA
jgi:hypothetical protein